MNRGIEFYLYTRTECTLCDVFRESLDKLGFQYHTIDIDFDPDLKHRYGARIPVLVAGNTEICEGSFNQQKIVDFMATL